MPHGYVRAYGGGRQGAPLPFSRFLSWMSAVSGNDVVCLVFPSIWPDLVTCRKPGGDTLVESLG
jgi:hypothetical protein